MGQTQATKEAIWLRQLLTELNQGKDNQAPTAILADNQGAIALASNPFNHGRAKHIDIQWHFVREAQENGHVQIQFVSTISQAADGLTKALPREPFERFRIALGLTTRAGD
ncbi:hypothetical protein KJE20_14174 [Pyrenophora tritici-repentis]|nr:hypothetical protein KJE20_14174 [Pyrenophora tritici-repentis]